MLELRINMQKSLSSELLIIVFKAVTVVLTIVFIIVGISFLYDYEDTVSDGLCNIAVLPIEGVILPYYGLIDVPLVVTPGDVEAFLDSVESEDTIKAVLLEINSPGGTPVASERIAERLRTSELPIFGLIGDVGASGGYMIAAATDHLIASAMSDIGSIGVTMSYLEESGKNEEEGLTYVQLTTGKFKDIGSPNRPITDEERELLQKDLDVVHNHFIDLVTKYRNLPREEVEKIADGSTMTGVRALDSKLIDEVGGRQVAKTAFAKALAMEESDIVFCEYEAPLLGF